MHQLLWVPISATLMSLYLTAFHIRWKCSVYLAVLTSIASAFLTIFYLASDSFTGDGINESTLFHVLYGMTGINISQFSDKILYITAATIIFFIIVRSSVVAYHKRHHHSPWYLLEITALLSLTVFSVITHPATLQLSEIGSSLLSTTQDAENLSRELATIQNTKPKIEKPKSLVYIYAESLEHTFFDDSIFPSLITELKEIEKSSLSIRGIRQAPMTEWTIAGMVSSQCGIPLSPFRSNRNDLSDKSSFIPGATCLGDIFKASGYNNLYIGGANLEFAGKMGFYATHGFDNIIGLKDIQNKYGNSLPTSKWGIYDDTLFEEAYNKFREASDSDKPFSIFLLTLDTHPPSGHQTPACKDIKFNDGKIPILNSIKCSDHLISQFIRKIELYPSHHDLVIVLASDHLQMRNDVTSTLEAHTEKRENLLIIRNPRIQSKLVYKEGTTLDIGPTILSMLGWQAKEMALGRNLLGVDPTLLEKYGKSRFFSMLQNWRLHLWKAWSNIKIS